MTVRARLRHLHELQNLQRIERDVARHDHAEACHQAEASQAAAGAASRRATAAADRWYEARASRTFDPVADGRLAAALIAAERGSAEDAKAVVTAQAECARREDAWRQAEARRRAGDRIVRDLRRDLARADEEARLESAAGRRPDRERA